MRRSRSLDPTRDNVLAHQRVNETVMQRAHRLPMSFGTVFKTRDDVMELLRSAYRAFSDVLNKMEDKLEFGLKVLWDRDAIIRAIEQEDEDIHRLKNEICGAEGLHLLRADAVRPADRRRAAGASLSATSPKSSSAARRVGCRARQQADRRPDDPQCRVPGDRRDAERRSIAASRTLGARDDKLTFKYTGPWPPYNFVNIRLKLERA